MLAHRERWPDTRVILLCSPLAFECVAFTPPPSMLPSPHPRDWRQLGYDTVLDSEFPAMAIKSDFGILCLLLLPAYLFSPAAESSSWLIRLKKRSPWSDLSNNGIRIQSDIWPVILIIHDFAQKVMSRARVILLSAELATETRCYLVRYLLNGWYVPSSMLSTVGEWIQRWAKHKSCAQINCTKWGGIRYLLT